MAAPRLQREQDSHSRPLWRAKPKQGSQIRYKRDRVLSDSQKVPETDFRGKDGEIFPYPNTWQSKMF